MSKMGGSVSIFNENDFSYWKTRMQAYVESISPEVWEAVSVGYPFPYTLEQAKWDGKARNALTVRSIEGSRERAKPIKFGLLSLKYMRALRG